MAATPNRRKTKPSAGMVNGFPSSGPRKPNEFGAPGVPPPCGPITITERAMKSESPPASRTSKRVEWVPVAEKAWLALNVADQAVSHTPSSSQSQRAWRTPFDEVEAEASNVTIVSTWRDVGGKVKSTEKEGGGGGAGASWMACATTGLVEAR